MDAIRYQTFDAVLPGGDSMLRLAESFGAYGMYHVESIEDNFGENIAQPVSVPACGAGSSRQASGRLRLRS